MKHGTKEYRALHKWVVRNFVKTGCCVICESPKVATQWASVEHVYTRDRKDWREVCVCIPCHWVMDGGHEFTEESRQRLKTSALGRRHTAEARANMSRSGRGRKMPPRSAESNALVAMLKWRREHETIRWACG